ncbi:hypothetical protein [Haladaptatus sp. NG-WS-4]
MVFRTTRETVTTLRESRDAIREGRTALREGRVELEARYERLQRRIESVERAVELLQTDGQETDLRRLLPLLERGTGFERSGDHTERDVRVSRVGDSVAPNGSSGHVRRV